MSRNSSIALLTFDLDNTLWSVRQVIGNAERHMRALLETEVPGFNAQFRREDLLRTRELLLPEYPEIRHDLTQMRQRVLTYALRAYGLSDHDAQQTALAATEAFLHGRHEVEFFPDALNTLRTLSRYYTIAALSNGNADVERLGLGEVFAFSCSAAEIGASKPQPDMFEAALAKAGVRPEAAAHIGDHPVDDIQGASQVGMHTILVELDGVEPHPGAVGQATSPSAVVSTLAELPDVIRTLTTGD
ncbi:MAG: HAD-IA family hydrolase [Pseudomonadota bacterium]